MKAIKVPLAALGLVCAVDLGALDTSPPPFSFDKDLNLPVPAGHVSTYKQPATIDTSYWQNPSGYHP